MTAPMTGGGGGRPRQTITIRGYATEIEGLREFNRALKRISDEYGNAVRDANYELASEVVTRSRRRAALEPGVAAKAARSLRASRSANQATVTGGGARAPYFFGAEFGSIRYRQFQRWRGNQFTEGSMPGYFLHPTIREDGPVLIREYLERLDALHREAFPEEG